MKKIFIFIKLNKFISVVSTGGLVEREIGFFAEGPGFAFDFENEAGGGDLGAGVVDDFAADADFTEFDQLAALTPAAETLVLEDAFEFHGRADCLDNPLLSPGILKRATDG